MQIDPLLSLLVGALGAALLGLLGAWIQSRREHVKWVREQRLAAYLDFVRAGEGLSTWVRENTPTATKRYEDLLSAVGAVRLVGPNEMFEAASAYLRAANEFSKHTKSSSAEDQTRVLGDLVRTREAQVRVARRVLGFKGD